MNGIIASLRDAAKYNSHELAAPRVILWLDEERLWSACLDLLRSIYPNLWLLGDYDPDKATGPAVWLRYRLENYVEEGLPVIYLPGIGRPAFRSPEQFPNQARHLFALQYQGQFWTQKNGKDWTPFAFLSSSDGGLGLDVASDQKTKNALHECLLAFLAVNIDELRVGKLESADFRAKVTKDPARTLLRWMSDAETTRLALQSAGSEWNNFRELCRDKYGFDPESDGAITSAEKLSGKSTGWTLVWDRSKESPQLYPGIKQLLGSIPPANLFEEPSEYRPLSNKKEEERLETDLLSLGSATPNDASAKIKSLAADHFHRSNWVWAALGDSPLAVAIGHLRDAVDVMQTSGSPLSWEALADYYATDGWKADRSVVRALDTARSVAGTKAVTAAIRAVYRPWLERLAEIAQGISAIYPNTGPATCRIFPAQNGTIYVFADGLRMDMARGLEEKLVHGGLEVTFEHSWTALPSVTATAKPAWTPLAEKLGGPLEAGGFQPKENTTGKALTHERFRKLMDECGISYVSDADIGSPTGCGWTESSNFDTYGHDQGAKLAWRVDEELQGLEERVRSLLAAGWTKIQVVTDHGWLMLPGGLPKVELPKHLTNSQWGRCANPGAGAQHGFPETSWFWDAADAVVLAPGISCFMAGLEYSHGELTIQEAVIPSLLVTAGKTAGLSKVVLSEFASSGLRLNMVFEGAEGLNVDIRGKVADAGSSYVVNQVTASANGQRTSLLVADDDAIGTAAFLVVTD